MRQAAKSAGLEGVEWPTLGEAWRDTGEGGLYAAAWWPHREEWDRCCVSALASLWQPDVLSGVVGPNPPQFDRWADHERSRVAWEAKYPTGPSFYESAEWERSGLGDAVGALFYLGSTPHSLWDDRAGEYFCLDWPTLSTKGRALVEAAEALYGPATLLTFLDT